MCLKQKGYCVGVLLIYTITIIALPSVGWCEPTHSFKPNSLRAFHNVRNGDLTAKGPTHPSSREGSQRGEVHTTRGEQVVDHLGNRDEVKTSGESPDTTLRAGMASTAIDTSFKNHHKLMQTERDWTYSPLDRSNEDCSEGNVNHISRGKFYIIGQLEPNIPKVGHQSDSALSVQAEEGQARTRDQWLRGSEESWQRLQPVVECGEDAMTLIVRRRRAVQLLLDRANESSVALSELPPHCGYSVQTTWRNLSLMAHYDACHVTQEEDNYVLPLLWRGIPVKMSCPVTRIYPHTTGLSSLCCSLYGMTVKVQGQSAADMRINVRGEWTPLLVLAEQCGYISDTHGAEIVITAPYLTCGITVKDGKYTLSLQVEEKTFTLSCPAPLLEELPLTHQPLINSRALKPETLEPFPWAPPFYLAPPYYPHPTYHHKYPRADVHNPLTPSSLTPDSAFGPQPFPPVDFQPDYVQYYSHQIPVRQSYKQFGVHSSPSSTDEREDSSQAYPDLQQKQAPVSGVSEKHSAAHSPCSATDCPVQVEALQPPSHAFNPYYHYYHHPKIPLPGPPQDPDPGPEVLEELPPTNSHALEVPLLTPNVQQSEAHSDQAHQPVHDAAFHPYIVPASTKSAHQAPAPHTPYPQPYPHHYFYNFPQIARGEAKRLAALHHIIDAKENLSITHPFSHSLVLPFHHKYNDNPQIDQPNADEIINDEKYSADWIKNPLLTETDDVTPGFNGKKRLSTPVSSAPPSGQPSYPSTHNPPPYPYNYYPYYRYQMYYAPESLQSTNDVPPTSFKEASDPLPEVFSSASLTESVQNAPLHPYYYYYHLFYKPKVSKDTQELHPAGSVVSEKASSNSQSNPPPDSDHSRINSLRHSPEAGYSGKPWPLHSFYSHYRIQQHPYATFEYLGGEESEENLDNEMKGCLQANIYTPSASPCGFGPASDFCCSCPVKDCTMGQHFVFALPDSVVEPTVAPPGHLSETRNVSCTLQKLTSDPDFYTVPLDGCGVNKHVFGDTVVHLLEVQGLNSLHQDHDSMQEYTPVRVMVECSSSPGSPGEVRLHVMDHSPPPTQSPPATITVQLRIATDESFTSYHSEAHLPLSLVHGRPLYLEVNLLDPPESDLVLLVQSCLAYTQAPYSSWMPVYNRHIDSQLLPALPSVSHHIRKIIIPSFLSLPSDTSSHMAKGGPSLMEDPEIYFLCLTEVCSAAGVCSVGWTNN